MIHGNIQDLNLIDVLQLIHSKRQSGELSIKSSSKRGQVFFEDGNIIHAETDENSAEEAIHNILSWKEGEYSFSAIDKLPKRTIQKNLHNIIIDFTRQNDEIEEINKVIPSLEALLRFNPNVNSGENVGLSLQPKEWKILSLVNGKRTIREIGKKCSISEEEAKKVIYRLVSSGVLEISVDTDGHNSGGEKQGGGIKSLLDSIGKAIGFVPAEKDEEFTERERVEDEALLALEDFINQYIEEFAETAEVKGILEGLKDAAGSVTIGADRAADASSSNARGQSADSGVSELNQEYINKLKQYNKYVPIDLISIVYDYHKELVKHDPTMNLITVKKKEIDISKVETRTSINSPARKKIREALGKMIKAMYEETEKHIDHETAVFRYNKIFKRVFYGDRDTTTLGISDLVKVMN